MTRNSLPLAVRGVHLDCRAQMMRFTQIVEIFHDLARWGFNTVLLEYEDRFPFRGHLKTVSAPDALTAVQVRELNRIAASLGLRIIPLVQCLGHLEYVLRRTPFQLLREGKENRQDATICPSRHDSLSLFREMASQVLELHEGCRWFHLGGDEVGLNEQCPRCGPRLKKEGLSRMLVEHYGACADWLRGQGPDPIMWGDMLLAHPEELARLRGRVTVMDWDYWSAGKIPDVPVLWGFRDRDVRKPATWPPLYRQLFENYILTYSGLDPRPFPYTPFLRDQGFPVILAPAARSAGDNFCAPSPLHIENVVSAARMAHGANILGSVITSWALRRAPWPLTENILIAGGLAMQDAATSRLEMDTRFVEEHFNVSNPRLAKIPLLLGAPLEWGVGASLARFDGKTGQWLSPPFAERIEENLNRDNFPQGRRRARTLTTNCRKAMDLLSLARPRTVRQHQRTVLWRWAAETMLFYARLAGQIRPDRTAPPPATLRVFHQEIVRLSATSRRVLVPFYTSRTLEAENQTRIDSCREWLEAHLSRGGMP